MDLQGIAVMKRDEERGRAGLSQGSGLVETGRRDGLGGDVGLSLTGVALRGWGWGTR